MKRSKKGEKTDEYVRQILEALQGYTALNASAKIDVYRYNPASIRIRIVDPGFKGLNKVEREEQVWKILEKLPDDTQQEISILLLLTPEEKKTSFLSLEFDDRA